MFRLRSFRTWLTMTLVFAIGVPWQPLTSNVPVQRSAQSVTRSVAAVPSANPLAAEKATSDLQQALDLLVNQAISSLSWKVASVNSQLDPASLQSDVMQESGSGQWTIQGQDDQSQAITLQGTLTFDSGSEAQTAAYAANAKIKGTLSGGGVSLDLDLSEAGNRSRDTGNQTIGFTLKLTRNGSASNLSVKRTIDLKSIAYGLSQTVNHTTITQDGKSHDWTQTVTARNFGKGESEIWLQAALSAGANQPPDMTLDQHFFQRGDGGQLTQYIDKYDLHIADQQYSLKAPATAQASLDGRISTNVVLIDSQGNTLTPPSGGGGLQSRAVAGSLVSIGSSARLNTALTIVRMMSLASSGDYARLLGLCGDLTSSTGGFLIGVAATIAAAYLFGAEIILFDLIVGNLATAIIGAWQKQALANATTQEQRDAINAISLLLQLGIGFAGITSPGGVAGLLGNFASFLGGAGAGKACNGDPYFLYPDVRSMSASTPAPIEITRVSGGLISISSTMSLAASSGGPAQPIGQGQFNEYTDRPDIFVGGSIPTGATSIGTWTWDSTQTFGAAASHTSGLIDGPSKHYFIHAAKPLNVTADDNLVQYVYIDPQNPPEELVLQLYTGDGDGEHRAMWGGDLIQTGGSAGTASAYPAGGIPPTGQWVRLRVPVDQVNLAGKQINGVLYGSYGGQVWWGPTTTSSQLTDNSPVMLQVQGPQALPQTLPGAQIAFNLAQAASVSLKIVDAQGAPVRTLLQNENRSTGYQVAVWDAKDDSGKAVADVRYQYQLNISGQDTLKGDVSISPLVARIQAPTTFGMVRGNVVPVIGEAYGATFKQYTLEYGKGLSPTSWTPIMQSNTPVVLPPDHYQYSNLYAGNLASWDTGVNEFKPYQNEGLSGVYTLRLRVNGNDDREVIDTTPVIVGRLAHSAEGGTITSSDGKARLIIPPLATQDAFALMAIVPEAQVDPSNAYQATLPSDKQLSGDVYEIFPPDETFRQPAVLELPYNPDSATDKLGVLIGDGTSNGWRYIGGVVDTTQQVIRVNVTDFGGERALVAAFVSDNFGSPQPYRIAAAPFAFEATNPAPIVSSSTAPVAFYNDFESTPDQFAALDQFGTQLSRVNASDAGEAAAGNVLKVTRLADGARLVQVRSTPYDATKYPLIVFDYRAPADYMPNLLVKSNGYWWQFKIGNDGYASSKYYQNINLPPLTNDDQWHHAQIDVLGYLRAVEPEATSFQVDEVVLGQMRLRKYMQVLPIDNGAVGSAYYIDNFAALTPINRTQIPMSWAGPSGVNYGAYSVAFDQKSDTQPATALPTSAANGTASVPNSGGDGLYYFHVLGRLANGQWTTSANYPIVIDRQPPTIGDVTPENSGAGGPNFIQATLVDTNGLDLSKLQIQINNKSISVGRGVIFDPEFNALQIQPYALKTPLPAIPNGQKVTVALNVQDYAGNALALPFSWSFAADVPIVSGQQVRALTKNGGESPVLSPDGNTLAFITNRSGTPQIWLISATDYSETSNSAHALISGNANTFDPAWSPDGNSIAFVSNASGSNQIWVSDANGGGAKAITSLAGSIGSPTWSPDGHIIAFVQDGNIWQVNADGTGLQAVTTYPDRPIQKVKWQPNGNVLAVDFKLYQETIELYDLATNQLTPLTNGGIEHDPAWLNGYTLLYAAPQDLNQPDAIWKINTDGSDARMIDGSGLPGVADTQPSSALDGSSIAMVSTRNGTRDIYLQATLQIARFDVSPSTGIVPGDSMQINYSLPTDADVTLQVLGADGKPLKTLINNVHETKGVQAMTWDGTGSDGKPVPYGDYQLKLSASIAGESIERYATARVLDASNIGKLQIQINQWANQPATHLDLRVDVYPSGPHLLPLVANSYGDSQLYKLPAGQYDLVVTYQGQRYEFDRLQVQAQQTTNQTLDLHLGGLQVTVESAPGQTAGSDTFVTIVRHGDPASASVGFNFGGVNNFVLPPGRYDIYTEYQGVRKTIANVEVQTAQITQQTVNLGSGSLHYDVFAYAGQVAYPDNLIVYAYRPGDHQTVIGQSLFRSPFDLLLPAGTYDLLFDYGLGHSAGSGGDLKDWETGVEVQSGEVISLTHNFHLGEVQIDVSEAAGKPADTNLITFYIYRPGERTNQVAQGLFANTGKFQLPPGQYEVVAQYYTTDLDKINPPTILQVTEGQSSSASINLHAGRVQVQVNDAPGQVTDKNRVTAYAYPAGKRDVPFSNIVYVNPLSLIVPAGVPFDVDIALDTGKHLILSNQVVQEGQTLTLNVNVSDFK